MPNKSLTRIFLHFAVLASVGLAIYSNVLSAPFLYDDSIYVTGNPAITSLSNAIKFSGTRYVTFLSFAVNYAFSGLSSTAFHATNAAIHIINAFLLCLLILATLKTPAMKGLGEAGTRIAFGASLVFLTHPLATQAVSYVTQRFASLTTLFYLLSLVLYAKARLSETDKNNAWRWVAACAAITIVAQLTKEIAFTLPIAALLYEFAFFEGVSVKKRLITLLPVLAALIIIPLVFLSSGFSGSAGGYEIAEKVRGMQIDEMASLSKYDYLLTEFTVVVSYLRLLLFPVNQSAVYEIKLFTSALDPAVLASFALLAALFCIAVFVFFRSKKQGDSAYGLLISFGILWFFLALTIESSVIPIKDTMFEHRAYLPGIGMIIASTTLIHSLCGNSGKAFWAVIMIITAVFSVSTYSRNFIWADELAFWQDAVKKAPARPDTHYNLGINLAERGMDDTAINEFKEAVRIAPRYDDAYFNLGVLYSKKGLTKEAIRNYETAVNINPSKNADARLSLNLLYKTVGKKDGAEIEFQKALEADGIKAGGKRKR